MKKGLFLLGFIPLLLSILSGCDKKEPVLIIEEFMDFRVIDYEPAWSPDGQWIAFYHGDTVPDKWGIYLISPDGENIKKWHDGPAAATPTWSPDGQWIAFSGGAQIWKKKIDGDSLTQLTFEGRNFFPSWSPDGQWIVHVQTVCNEILCGLWLIDMRDDNHTPIVRYGMFPEFHPINNSILYCTRWVEKDGQVYGDSLFYYDILTKSSSKFIILHRENYSNQYFKINLDGSKIVFTSKPHDKPHFRIWTMDADGSNLKRLTDTQAYTCDWSPDGRYIVYTDARTENGRLWIMDADGSNKRQLTFEHHFINF
ncbi:MAG: DPP IV N-terminal domain-containing protein [Paludibacter sp.]|nr:DPP IV N-terminal domain-containing protein [Paludibacter sp.]MDD4427159.1 DPP IV N-terminal domain-containing protein [Paludibacter sp.]